MNNTIDFWKNFEDKVGEKFPPCVVELLKECGYNETSTLSELSKEIIVELENYIENNLKHVVANLKCCNSHTYLRQNVFKFLPAHKNFILSLKGRIDLMKSNSGAAHSSNDRYSFEQFPRLLKIFIQTVESNLNKVPTQFRYNEVIRYFSMYIHMVCGKMCYETLSGNLPLPKSSTVRK